MVWPSSDGMISANRDDGVHESGRWQMMGPRPHRRCGIRQEHKDDCLPSVFNAVFLPSIGDAVRELGRPMRGDLRRATAMAMSKYGKEEEQ